MRYGNQLKNEHAGVWMVTFFVKNQVVPKLDCCLYNTILLIHFMYKANENNCLNLLQMTVCQFFCPPYNACGLKNYWTLYMLPVYGPYGCTVLYRSILSKQFQKKFARLGARAVFVCTFLTKSPIFTEKLPRLAPFAEGYST